MVTSFEAEEVPRVQGPRSALGELLTKRWYQRFAYSLAETARQLVGRRERKEVGNTVRLIYDLSFDAFELCWHVKRSDEYKRISGDSWANKIAVQDSARKVVRSESCLSVSEAVLNEKIVLTDFWKEMAMDSSQDLFWSPQDVPE